MPFLGEISALITAALWSVSSLAFASASRRLGSTQVNIARLILATLYLWLVVILFGLEFHLSRTQVLNLAVSGIIGLALGDSFLFKAYRYIGARLTMVVMSIAPAVAAIGAYFMLGEHLSATGTLGILLTLCGIALVILEQRDGSRFQFSRAGVFYAFLGAVGQGVGLIFAKQAFVEGEINGFVAALVRLQSSLLLLLPVLILARRWENPLGLMDRDRKGTYQMILGSVVGPFLGISFSLLAVKHTSVGVAATLMATVPIMMLPIVRVLYKEELNWRAVGGAVIAVGGVGLLFAR
jgi:drug/metabolite transporter (DMT)-like permease